MEDTSEELLLDTDGEQESTLNNPMVDMLAHINQNIRLHGRLINTRCIFAVGSSP